VTQLVNSDELHANLPHASHKFDLTIESKFSRGGALDLASIVVGTMSSLRRFVKSQDLLGDCQGATHIVAGAEIGASALLPGKLGQMRSVTNAFDAATEERLNSPAQTVAHVIGDPKICKEATPAARPAVQRCAAPIRLHLSKIGATPEPASDKFAAVPTECARGLVMSRGKCAHLMAAEVHQCDPSDSKDCAEQCQRGDARSCFILGVSYERGDRGAADMAKAAALYGQACDGGDAAGCFNLGVITESGRGAPRDLRRAAASYEKACEGGEARGCLGLGIMRETGAGVPEDLVHAVTLYERACDASIRVACDRLAQVCRSEKRNSPELRRTMQSYKDTCYGGEPANCASLSVLAAVAESVSDTSPRSLHVTERERKMLYERACHDAAPRSCLQDVAEYEQSCAAGKGEDCFTLGLTYYGLADHEDKHLPMDLARAALMFERACALGQTDACSNLGNMYSDGDQVPKDLKRAAELYEQACDHGVKEACANLGKLLENGNGIPKDVDRAAKLYEQACQHGVNAICNHLGWLYLLGQSVAKNTKLGLAALKHACESGDASSNDACDSYAYALLNGIGTQRNEPQALELFEKACKSGIEASCVQAGFMHLFGRATERDKPKADALFKVACASNSVAAWEESCSTHGFPEECGIAGLIWHTGACGKVDQPRAAVLLAKGCRDGWSWPCQRAKEFEASP
jgi:TPR repeat protein